MTLGTVSCQLAVDQRKKLALSLERQPTSGEWANAMGMAPGEFEEVSLDFCAGVVNQPPVPSCNVRRYRSRVMLKSRAEEG